MEYARRMGLLTAESRPAEAEDPRAAEPKRPMVQINYELKEAPPSLRDSRIKSLEDRLNTLMSERDDLIKRATEAETKAAAAETKARKLEREQAEADLLFVSMKIIFELMQGKKVVEVGNLVAQQANHQQHLAALQQAGNPFLAGLLSLAGLGGTPGIRPTF